MYALFVGLISLVMAVLHLPLLWFRKNHFPGRGNERACTPSQYTIIYNTIIHHSEYVFNDFFLIYQEKITPRPKPRGWVEIQGQYVYLAV